jgi:hypothetical protein
MTGHDEIETRLIQAMAITPSAPVMQRLDERVAAMLAAPAVRPMPPFARRLLRPMLLAAALALAAGAVAAALTLIDRLAEEVSPGWATAWDRAEVLGIRQTDGDVTLTLERAYVDLNQVMLGVSVDGLGALPDAGDGTRNDHRLSWVVEIRGPGGWRIHPEASGDAARVVEGEESAVIFTFGSPPYVAGPWELSVSSVGYGEGNMTDGTWDFAFELPEPVGTTVTSSASDTVGDATLTLTELRIAPSTIVARIRLDVDGTPLAYWSAGTGQDGEVIRHGEATFQIAQETIHAATPEENGYLTASGSDEAAGTWEVVIPELGYTTADGENVSLVGPWTLTVTVP